ncbi:MAG: substrate-binding domain-containing protein [Bdellovibrionaceae bacterium]|nr:substrate-binding domain-containing protein [Pseudobdellovibrionaceae bacterium]NUM57937.1 substrate-binding domain-containing protein [Pseudobdellovibrionaceae bacterium]
MTIILTDEGLVTLKECTIIFNAIENLKSNIVRAKSILSGELKLASTNSIALSVLAPALKIISKKHPELHIRLKMGNSDQVKEYLRTQDAEIGFILEDDEMEGLDSREITQGDFLLVANCKEKNVNSCKEIIITRPSKIEVNLLKKKLGSDIQFKLEVFSWELIRQLCLDGAGVGYLPDYLVVTDIKKEKLQIVKPDIKLFKYKLLSVNLKGRILNSAAEEFLKILKSRI